MKTKPTVIEHVREHARKTYPEECCGFLLGRTGSDGNQIERSLPVENSRHSGRERRFTITPDDYLGAEQEARRLGLDVVGVYHSHPDHPARPSETDLQEATFPGLSYVIVSVVRGEPTEPTAWALAPDRSHFDSEPIHQIT